MVEQIVLELNSIENLRDKAVRANLRAWLYERDIKLWDTDHSIEAAYSYPEGTLNRW